MKVVETHSVDFIYELDEMDEISNILDSVNQIQNLILNHLVHHIADTDQEWTLQSIPNHLRKSVIELLETPLLIEDENNRLVVPWDVIFLPDGPGKRFDQITGILHRFPEETIREWFELLVEGETESINDLLLYRKLGRSLIQRQNQVDHEVLDSLPAGRYFNRAQLAVELPTRLKSFYEDLEKHDSALHSAFLDGIIFPYADSSTELEIFIKNVQFIPVNDEDNKLDSSPLEHREVEWERPPFSPEEQVKFLLIASDAIPFRKTKDEEPHTFDLKDVSRITEWPLRHIQYLTNFVLEQNMLVAGDERYYMTERADDWDSGEFNLHLFTSSSWFGGPEDHPSDIKRTLDFSAGDLLKSTLRSINSLDEPVEEEEFSIEISNHESFWNCVMALPEAIELKDDKSNRLAASLLKVLYFIGLLDRLQQENKTYYRINNRGKRVLKSGTIDTPDNEELPLILQPDGQLLVPIESPLREFRRVNPFALLVEADRMVGYQLDRQSLVQALNEGWDAVQFREFLGSKTDNIPDPLQDLFSDTVGDVESISVEDVYHLIRFETGATAAKAVNILSNYDPERIDEKIVVLKSETKTDTIRRNLSRGGIRIRSDDKGTGFSPVININ